MKLTNLKTEGLRGTAFAISQCTRISGAPGEGNCTNPEFQIKYVVIDGPSATSKSTRIASLQCSVVELCTNNTMVHASLHFANGTAANGYFCGNVVSAYGIRMHRGVICGWERHWGVLGNFRHMSKGFHWSVISVKFYLWNA